MDEVSLLIAFSAGLLSFLCPCVLPLFPAYISFISGLSVDKLQDAPGRKGLKKILIATFLFILGFSSIFVLLGASATYMGRFILSHKGIIRIILGIIVIIFGLHLLGAFKIGFLQYEKRFHFKKRPATILGSFLIGIAFGFGWTPCIGPILGSILSLAATEESVKQGILLLAFYSLGLGLPFLLVSMGISTFFAFFSKIRRYFSAISVISGILLIGVGIWIILRV
ncbi:MAG: cytochrome c biogenesis protein CcdA [bacterium]